MKWILSILIILAALGTSYAAISDVGWSLGPNHPSYRKGGVLGVFEGAIYSVCGCEYPWAESNKSYSYEISLNQWWQRPNMLVGLAYTSGIDLNDELFIAGGRRVGNDGFWTKKETYKLSRNAQGVVAWTQLSNMIEDRGFYTLAKVGNKLIAAGGNKNRPGQDQISPTSTMNAVEYLDTTNQSAGWHSLPPFPGLSRCASAAVGVGNKLYLFGGCHMIINSDQTSTYLRMNEALVFDTTTNQWSQIANLPEGRSSAFAVAYKDRYIIIFGGCTEVIMPPPGEVGWYNDNVIVYDTFNNSYKTMPSPWPNATGDSRAVIIGNTIYAVYGENIDSNHSNTDNTLRIGSIVEIDDIVPPTGSIQINNGARYTSTTSVTLNLPAQDDDSGVGFMRLSSNGTTWNNWINYENTFPWTISSGSGQKTVYVQYKDNTGNVSSSYLAAITLDTLAPSGTIQINSGAQYTNNTSVALTLTASDNSGGSGVDSMRFSNDGSSWSNWLIFASSKAWTLDTSSGNKTVYVQYSDSIGNISSSFSDSIILDTIAPNPGNVLSPANTNSSPFNITFSGVNDAGSGLKIVYLYYKKEATGTWMNTGLVSYASSGTFSIPAVNGYGTYFFDLVAEDNVGNRSSLPSGSGDTSTLYTLQVNKTITSKIILSNWQNTTDGVPVTINVKDANESIIETHIVTLNAIGNFSFNTNLAGTYNIGFKASHWLSKTTSGVVFTVSTIMDPVTLINGDVVDNNEVDFSDINAVRAAYGSFPGDETWNAMADVDGTGEVDFTDINIVRSNYGEIGE